MSLPKKPDPNKTNFANGDLRESLDCCCALLTGPGRSAVAVIGVRGREASELVSRCFLPARQSPFRPGQVRYGQWTGRPHEAASDASISTAESVVIVPLEAGDFEIHCHGGVAASARIINDLWGLGAERLEAAQWAGDVNAPLLIREAERVLTGCLTAPMAAIAMDQIRGAMLDWCENARRMLPDLAPATLDKIRVEAKAILLTADLGLRLGWRYQVVLLGPPNVGKSSLVNAIVGYDRSITMDLAGTTRDVLHADTVVAGVPIRLSDTAGLRESIEPIELEGVARARSAASDADLVVLVSDPETPWMDVPPGKRPLKVFNKSDLAANVSVLDGPRWEDGPVIQTVATRGLGVDKLMDAIAASLVQFPASDTPVPVTPRQVDLLRQLAEATEAKVAATLLARLIHG